MSVDIDKIRTWLAQAEATVRRGQVPQTFLARMGVISRADMMTLTAEAPDVKDGLRRIARGIAANRTRPTALNTFNNGRRLDE